MSRGDSLLRCSALSSLLLPTRKLLQKNTKTYTYIHTHTHTLLQQLSIHSHRYTRTYTAIRTSTTTTSSATTVVATIPLSFPCHMIFQFEELPHTMCFCVHHSRVPDSLGINFRSNEALSLLDCDPSGDNTIEVSSTPSSSEESDFSSTAALNTVPVKRGSSGYDFSEIQHIPKSIIKEIVEVDYYMACVAIPTRTDNRHSSSIRLAYIDSLPLTFTSKAGFERSRGYDGDHDQTKRRLQVSIRSPRSYIVPYSPALFHNFDFISVTGHFEGPVDAFFHLNSKLLVRYGTNHLQLKSVIISVHLFYQMIYSLAQVSETVFCHYHLVCLSRRSVRLEHLQRLPYGQLLLSHEPGGQQIMYYRQDQSECLISPCRLSWRYVLYFHWLISHVHVVNDEYLETSSPEAEDVHKDNDSDGHIIQHWVHYHERSRTKKWRCALRRLGRRYPHDHDKSSCYNVVPQMFTDMFQHLQRVPGEPPPLPPRLFMPLLLQSLVPTPARSLNIDQSNYPWSVQK